MKDAVDHGRRRFVVGSGTGLLLGFALPGCAARVPPPDDTIELGALRRSTTDHTMNAWIRVADSGLVTLRMASAEMGQGVYTALPLILAEELDADWSQVRVESAPTHRVYRFDHPDFPGRTQLTGGSTAVRGYWLQLREAGAAAREMLVAAAAQRWGVDPADCTTHAGVVHCGDRQATYGELAADAGRQAAPRQPRLKDPSEFDLLGTSPPRLDLLPKVDGSAVFGMDVQVPGMLHATVRSCPHHGGRLLDFDATAALAMPGVRRVLVVDGEEAVAVVADHFWQAKQALDKVEITWDPGSGAALDDVRLAQVMTAGLDADARTVLRHGRDPEATSLSAEYAVPYIEHATMEPLCATAWVRDNRVDLWAPTQAQQRAQGSAARIAGVPRSRVRVHTTFLGGGFGRKSFTDFTDQAVRLSLQVGAPVKLIWTREECFARGFYRPGVLCRMHAGLGPDGLPTDWRVQVASQNIMEQFLPGFLLGLDPVVAIVVEGLGELPYGIANQAVEYARLQLPLPVGWWRSVHGSHNAFFRECFLDECAHAAGQDPIAYRRALLADNPRFLACFDLAVQGAGELPEGQHRGVAIFRCFGSIVAEVADVSVVEGKLRVHRVTAALDCGQVVHPDTVVAQVEGAIGMGLSSMLGEKLSFKAGAVVQRNFHQYPLMQLRDMPRVDVHIVPSTEPPGGVGEVGLPPVIPAVCNAIFAATGRRIRSLPLADQLTT